MCWRLWDHGGHHRILCYGPRQRGIIQAESRSLHGSRTAESTTVWPQAQQPFEGERRFLFRDTHLRGIPFLPCGSCLMSVSSPRSGPLRSPVV